jgi:transposase InsO family protein
MPWKECSVVEERLRFVARLLDGEAMTDLCREFGISRKTGYKIFDRYKEHGLEALTDRSRRPVHYANQLPAQVESLIVSLKRNKPHWGARKIRELLLRRLPGDLRLPAKSTIHALLDRHGLVKRMGKRRARAAGTPLSRPIAPNDLLCADFKGEFKLGNGRYCYPLTVTDQASRFLLMCEALETTREEIALTAFERLFADRGLPQGIRSDNGVPFASPNALFNLSKLAVWWLRLGIAIERIKPGHPQQNGRHERMHLTLKKEATRPSGMNTLQQQARFDDFVQEFNAERPHEAIAMKCPAEVYTPSRRPYQGLPDLEYPLHDRDVLVTACGRICIYRKKINISTVLAGQRLGIKEVDEGIWLVTFINYDLGYIDLEQRTCNPSTTRSGQGCHLSLRYVLSPMCPGQTGFLVAIPAGLEPATLCLEGRCSIRLSYGTGPENRAF